MNLTLKIIKNNQTYTLSTPSLLEQNYNERIDNLSCKIVHLSNKINLKLKDKVIIQDTDNVINDLYMIVSSYSITQDGLDNGTYSYDLQLCSETKDMEGYILPQLSITPLKTNAKSIYDYLFQYNNEYGAKIRIDLGNRTGFTPKWHYSQKVIDKFSTIKAPELQWNMSTFREVITDLMMVADCIPTLKNNEIDCIDLTETFSPIEHYNYLTWHNDLSTYASELQMNMQNVLQTKIDGITNTTTTLEYIPFNSNDYTMTSENIVLKTKYPILKINKLELVTFTDKVSGDRDFSSKCFRRDFTNIDGYSLIVENKEYQIKEVLYSTQAFDPTKTGAYYSQYQNYCAYYNRGDNSIYGFDTITKKYGVFAPTYSTLEWWSMINSGYAHYNHSSVTARNNSSFYQYFFVIEYETTASQLFRTSKDDEVNNHIIIDNQTNSWVDAYTQGNLEKQKANRTGNETIMLNQRFKLDDNFAPVEVGDFYVDDEGNKNVVYQVQKQIFKDHIDVNAYMTKNYVLRNSFTGIDSKVRTWKNATDEAFEKQLLKKYYCEFSLEQRNEKLSNDKIANAIKTPLGVSALLISPLKRMLIRTKDDNNNYYPSSNEWYAVDLISRIMGNSLVFTGGFDNNAIVGKKIENTVEKIRTNYFDTTFEYAGIRNSNLIDSKGIKMQNCSYVDGNYEFKSAEIALVDNNQFKITNMNLNNNANVSVDDTVVMMNNVFKYPVVNNSQVTETTLSETFNNYKDNKEIPTFTLQYEFCSDTRDIYFTPEFLKVQRSVKTTGSNLPTIKLVNYKYGQIDRSEGTNLEYWSVSSSILNDGCVKITLSGNSIDLTNKALSIGYSDKNWIVINPQLVGEYQEVVFYLNILEDKNKNVYDIDNFDEKVGEI